MSANGTDAALEREVTALINREAMLLDRRRWKEWLELYAEDAVYWVPAWASEEETTTDPETQLNLIYLKDRGGLEDRVFRIESRQSWASLPLDRTVHLVGNVLVESAEGDVIEATANCNRARLRQERGGDPRQPLRLRVQAYRRRAEDRAQEDHLHRRPARRADRRLSLVESLAEPSEDRPRGRGNRASRDRAARTRARRTIDPGRRGRDLRHRHADLQLGRRAWRAGSSCRGSSGMRSRAPSKPPVPGGRMPCGR